MKSCNIYLVMVTEEGRRNHMAEIIFFFFSEIIFEEIMTVESTLISEKYL